MTAQRYLVINPNSNQSVTAGIDAAVAAQRRPDELHIDCITLGDAPLGIETARDIARVIPLVVSCITAAAADYDAFVIACYSDPGLQESRSACSRPVYGIHESALTLADSSRRRFGVLALGEESIDRHLAYVRRIGLQQFHVGERALNLSVDAAANDPAALARIVTAGRALIEENGAEMLILGCAGMASHRNAAEDLLRVPVIDPVQAAIALARKERPGLNHQQSTNVPQHLDDRRSGEQ